MQWLSMQKDIKRRILVKSSGSLVVCPFREDVGVHDVFIISFSGPAA